MMWRHVLSTVGVALAAVGLALALGGTNATPQSSPPPNFAPAPTVVLDGTCALSDGSGDIWNHLGTPRPARSLPGFGVFDVAVIAVDFADAPGGGSPEEAIESAMPGLSQLLLDLSNGNSSVRLIHNEEWIRVDANGAPYQRGDADSLVEFVEHAVSRADAELDFSSTEVVVILTPPNAPVEIGGVQLSVDSRFWSITADGRSITSVIAVGGDTYDDSRMVVIHELGHAFGLPDLYDTSGDGPIYTGNFGLMGADYGAAPELFAYERWVLGWIDDSQVACVSGDGGVRLTAVEVEGGLKAAIVPIGPRRLLVIESRRALGYDSDLSEEGALVYVVDLSVMTGHGPLVVYPTRPASREDSPLSVGESVTVDGVTVTSLWAGETDDIVQIAIDAEGR